MCDDRNQEDVTISTQVLVFTCSSGCTFHFLRHLKVHCRWKWNVHPELQGTKERTGQFSKDVTVSFEKKPLVD